MNVTTDDLRTILSDAEDAVLYGLHQEGDPPERDQDLLLLFRRMVATRLDKPGATFEDMVADTYEETPEEIRGWWSQWG
ncbi:hypothetical protein [Streptomyces sp. NPDC047097]|uniref:hypothetical protein n=1 Tax=Streptomyces sp. NPDC047097 TaxID=3155260 RepID=UPI0033CB47F3